MAKQEVQSSREVRFSHIHEKNSETLFSILPKALKPSFGLRRFLRLKGSSSIIIFWGVSYLALMCLFGLTAFLGCLGLLGELRAVRVLARSL